MRTDHPPRRSPTSSVAEAGNAKTPLYGAVAATVLVCGLWLADAHSLRALVVADHAGAVALLMLLLLAPLFAILAFAIEILPPAGAPTCRTGPFRRANKN